MSVYRPVSGARVKKSASALCGPYRRCCISDATRADVERPRILKATLDPSDLVYFANGRGEQEVVSRRPVNTFAIEDVRLTAEAGRRLTSHQR